MGTTDRKVSNAHDGFWTSLRGCIRSCCRRGPSEGGAKRLCLSYAAERPPKLPETRDAPLFFARVRVRAASMCYFGLFVYYTTILRVHGREVKRASRDQAEHETLLRAVIGYAREFFGL